MRKQLIEYMHENHMELQVKWVKKLEEDMEVSTREISSEKIFDQTGKEYVALLLALSFDSNNPKLDEKMADFIEKVVSFNWPLSFLVKGLQVFETIIFEALEISEAFQEESQLESVRDFQQWIHPLCNKIVQMYSDTWERTVSLQKMALQELSAPIIPVFDGITIMPLVGTIDTQRAKQIMENLLQGVVQHRSEVVLIDITGVPIVDTMVAHHIIQAVHAVRLVGTKSMIVGIRPEIAQTIVNLGIKLDQFETKNTLKKGMESALEYTNRKVVEVSE